MPQKSRLSDSRTPTEQQRLARKLETMTALYQAIELGLWKKEILRLDKG